MVLVGKGGAGLPRARRQLPEFSLPGYGGGLVSDMPSERYVVAKEKITRHDLYMPVSEVVGYRGDRRSVVLDWSDRCRLQQLAGEIDAYSRLTVGDKN
jgi:hypothetical protein